MKHIEMKALPEELAGIEAKINRLLSQKAALKNKLKKREINQRRARTRTLIQLGGLLNLTPLLSICGIELGDDLQLEYSDKAAILLGMLSCLSQHLPEEISSDLLTHYRRVGIRLLKG